MRQHTAEVDTTWDDSQLMFVQTRDLDLSVEEVERRLRRRQEHQREKEQEERDEAKIVLEQRGLGEGATICLPIHVEERLL